MSYDEFKELCRKSWQDYNYLCIDISKKRDQGRYCICNESKKNAYRSNTPDEGFLKTYDSYICNYKKVDHIHNFFQRLHLHSCNCCIRLKIEKI